MALHQSIKFNFGGPYSTITVGALEAIEINPPRLFDRLTEDIKPSNKTPIIGKSKFNSLEYSAVASRRIIEGSTSP